MAIIIYYLRDLNSSIFFILINIFMFLLTRDLKIVVPLVLLTTYLYTDCMFDYKEGAKNKKRKKKRKKKYVNGYLYVRETMEGRKKGGRTTGRKNSVPLNTSLWVCLQTFYVTTSGPLSNYQNRRGINTSNRVRLDSIPLSSLIWTWMNKFTFYSKRVK